MAIDSLDDATDAAQKILGKDAKIPKPKADMEKIQDELNLAFEEFDKARDAIEAAILEMQNKVSAYKNAYKQVSAQFEKEDFDLDPKNKDDAKKIQQAQKIYSGFFSGLSSDIGKEEKALDELDKHLIQLNKYKGPAK